MKNQCNSYGICKTQEHGSSVHGILNGEEQGLSLYIVGTHVLVSLSFWCLTYLFMPLLEDLH